jgi:hypothetical protein
MNTDGRVPEPGVMMLFFGPDGERPAEREIRERKARVVCARCPLGGECRCAQRRRSRG